MKDEEKKEFLKEYKMSLISGSILTISPSLAGILLWNRLPEKIAHFYHDPVAGSGGICDHLHVNLWPCSGNGH